MFVFGTQVNDMLNDKEKRIVELRERFKGSIDALEAQLRAALERVAQLEAQLLQRQESLKQEHFERELNISLGRSYAETEAVSAAEQANQQVLLLQGQLRERDAQLASRVSELSALQGQLLALQEAYEQARRQAAEELKARQADTDAAVGQLKQAKAEFARQVSELEAQLAERELQLTSSSGVVQNLRRLLDEKVLECTTLQDALSGAKQQVVDTSSTLSRLQTGLHERDGAIQARQGEVAALTDQLQRAQMLLGTTRKEHDAVVQDLQRLLQQKDAVLQAARAEYDAAQRQQEALAACLRGDADALKAQLAEAWAGRQQLEGERTRAHAELALERGRLVKAGERLAELEGELQRAREAEALTAAQADALRNKLKLQTSIFETSRKEHAQYVQDLQSSHADELRQMSSRFESERLQLREYDRKSTVLQQRVLELEKVVQEHQVQQQQQTRERELLLNRSRDASEQAAAARVDEVMLVLTQMRGQLREKELALAQAQAGSKETQEALSRARADLEAARQEAVRTTEAYATQTAGLEQQARQLRHEQQKQLCDTEARLQERAQRIEALEAAQAQQARLAEDQARELKQVQRELADARRQTEAAQSLTTLLQTQLSERATQLMARQSEVDVLQDRYERTARLLEMTKEEHRKAMEDVTGLLGEKDRVDRSMVLDRSMAVDSLQANVAALEAALQHERGELVARSAQVTTLQHDLELQRHDLDAAQLRALKADEKAARLVEQLRQADLAQQKVEAERDLLVDRLEKQTVLLETSKREHTRTVEGLQSLMQERQLRFESDHEADRRRMADLEQQLEAARGEVRTLDAEIQSQRNALRVQAREFERLTADHQAEQDRVQSLAETLATLQQRLQDRDHTVSAQEEALRVLQGKYDVQQSVLETLRQEHASRVGELEERLQAGSQAGKTEGEALRREVAARAQRVAELSAALELAEQQQRAEASKLQASVADLTAENSLLRTQLQAAQKSGLAAEKTLGELQAERGQSEAELQRLQTERDRLRSLLEGLRTDSQHRLQDLESLLEVKTRALADAQKDFAKDRQQLEEEAAAAAERASEKEQSLRACEQRLHALQAEHDALREASQSSVRSRDSDLSRAAASQASLKATISALELENERLTQALSEARQRLDAASAAEAEAARGAGQIKALQDALAAAQQSARAQAEALEQERARWAAEVEQPLRRQVEALQAQVKQAGQRAAAGEDSLGELTRLLDEKTRLLEAERAHQKSTQGDLAAQLARAKQELELAQGEVRSKAALMGELSREHTVLQQRLAQAKADEELSVQERDGLRASVAALQAQLEALQKKQAGEDSGAAALQAELAALRGREAAAQERVLKLEQRERELQTEIVTVRNSLATGSERSDSRIHQLEDELEEMTLEYAAAKGKWNIQHSSDTATIESLRVDLAALDTEVARLRENLAAAAAAASVVSTTTTTSSTVVEKRSNSTSKNSKSAALTSS